MRILRVAQQLYPETKGGGAYHVHALSRDQAALGHDVTVLTPGDGPEQETRDGYRVIRRKAPLSIAGNDVSPGVYHVLGRMDEFDVVHAHSHLYLATNMAAFHRKRRQTPLAITNHGLYSQSAPEWLFDGYLRTIGKWTFNAADIVLCYTEEERAQLRDRGVLAPVEVVHNGIDTTRFTPDGPEDDEVVGNPDLLFAGRLVDGKRPRDVLRAFDRIHEAYPEAGLTVCGDGPLRSELERMARQRALDHAVRFLGQVPYDRMPSVYRASDVLLLLSRAEGLPRTVLESLACGRPVVTSDLPQLRALTDRAGESVPVGDTDAVAAAVLDIVGDESRRQALGQRGRELVATDYAWSDTVDRTTRRLEAIRL